MCRRCKHRTALDCDDDGQYPLCDRCDTEATLGAMLRGHYGKGEKWQALRAVVESVGRDPGATRPEVARLVNVSRRWG